MGNFGSQAAAALPTVIATVILIAGVADDLRSRKFHNWLFLACTGVALAAMLISGGWPALYFSALGFGAGIVVLLPLVLMNMVGAGDMKLLAAFGIAAGWNAVIAVAILSLIWGALFGVLRILLSGQFRVLLANMAAIMRPGKREPLELHRMPFTVAILMGWLSHLVSQGVL